jgi:hypothetical protein
LLNNYFSYPGQACSGAESCFTGDCTDGKCPGAAVDEECTTDSQCLMGSYCVVAENRTCQMQLGNLAACVADEDCVNTHGCNSGNCTAYFSLADGVKTDGKFRWSVCASGESDAEGVCRTRTNTKPVTEACTAETSCEYTNADNTTTIDANSCQCALNAGGMSYCPLANGKLIN